MGVLGWLLIAFAALLVGAVVFAWVTDHYKWPPPMPEDDDEVTFVEDRN